jgi:hypothetical protein
MNIIIVFFIFCYSIMNFNLVSPYDSAEAFTARFKEDVQIPKNSSVYLNYTKIDSSGSLGVRGFPGTCSGEIPLVFLYFGENSPLL